MGNNDTHIKMLRITILIVLLNIWTAAFLVFGKSETAQDVVDSSSKAYGDQWSKGKITDWVASGKILIMGSKEKGPLDFTLMVKQKDKVKRVVHFATGSEMSWGSDGKKSWQKSGPLSGNAAGPVAYFIDSHTKRSIASLFDNNKSLKDNGPVDKKHAPESGSSKVIEVKNDKDQTTLYYIDDATSLINRIEFDTGGFYTMFFGNTKYPLLASFVFSDYRTVNGFVMPYKIEVYSGRTKIEELTFTSIQCNTGVKDNLFVP
jgi:hypothetical protein